MAFIPGPSIFSLDASRLGWRIEDTVCLGLHNKPIEKLINFSYRSENYCCVNQSSVKIRDWFAKNSFGSSDFFILKDWEAK